MSASFLYNPSLITEINSNTFSTPNHSLILRIPFSVRLLYFHQLKERIMRLIPIIFSIVILASCGGSKDVADSGDNNGSSTDNTTEVTNSDAEENAAPQENLAYGTIHITDSGCKVYIDTKDGDREVKMYPVNLEDKFKKDGLRIKFGWDQSRAPQPAGCDANMVVSVKDVTPYRGN